MKHLNSNHHKHLIMPFFEVNTAETVAVHTGFIVLVRG